MVQVYTDNDLSAYSGKPRPAYLQMLEDAESGQFDALLAWHPDRLHRSPSELEHFMPTMERAGVHVETVQSKGQLDFSTPTGRLFARQLGSFARYEVEQKIERQHAQERQAAEQGKPKMGGTRPYGYADDRVTVIEHEADVIREWAERILQGESLTSVMRDLNARGARTPATKAYPEGKEWDRRGAKRMLCSPRVAGLRQHARDSDHGVFRGDTALLFDAVWPAILDRRTWDRVRTVLDGADRRGPTPRRYLLSNLLRCGRCGHGMIAKRTSRDGRQVVRYFCNPHSGGCNRVHLASGYVEDFVRDAVREGIQSGAVLRRLQSDTTDDLRQAMERVSDIRTDLDALASDHGHQRISRSEWMAAREPLIARLEAAQRDLGRLETREAHPALLIGLEAWDAAWEPASVTRRAAMLRAVLEAVEVAPAVPGRVRFDADRLTLRWRG